MSTILKALAIIITLTVLIVSCELCQAEPIIIVSRFDGQVGNNDYIQYHYEVTGVDTTFWNYLITSEKFEQVTAKFTPDFQHPKYYCVYLPKTNSMTVYRFLKLEYGKSSAGEDETNNIAKSLLNSLMLIYESYEDKQKVLMIQKSLRRSR